MKYIKNAQVAKLLSIMVSISVSLASMGCGKTTSDISNEEEIICEVEEEIAPIEIKEQEEKDTKTLVLKKSNGGLVATTGKLDLFCMPGYINYGYRKYNDSLSDELDTDVYMFINRYIKDNSVRYFSLNNDVLSALDFNLIDTSNISVLDIWLSDCEDEIDLTAFNSNHYEKLSIGIDNSNNFEDILVFLAKLDLSNTELLFQFSEHMTREEIQRFIDLLGCFDSFDNLTILAHESFDGIDISNIKAVNLNLTVFKTNNDIDFKYDLNEKVYNFQIAYLPDNGKILNEVELHNGIIHSSRDDLSVVFGITPIVKLNPGLSKIFVTNNSRFEIPDSCYFTAHNIDTNIFDCETFSSLRNTRGVVGRTSESSELIYYNSNIYQDDESAVHDFNLRKNLLYPQDENIRLKLTN